jgi:hypothetical protein
MCFCAHLDRSPLNICRKETILKENCKGKQRSYFMPSALSQQVLRFVRYLNEYLYEYKRCWNSHLKMVRRDRNMY